MRTRTELRDEMRINGLLAREVDKTNSLWQEAFSLYKSETKDYQVSIECGMCHGKVKKWLEK